MRKNLDKRVVVETGKENNANIRYKLLVGSSENSGRQEDYNIKMILLP